MKKKIYYVELQGGYCGLTIETSLKRTEKKATLEHGTRNLAGVHEATKEEIDGVRMMGGYVPTEEELK